MVLQITLITLFLMSLLCIIIAFRVKRHNNGFIIMSSLVLASDIICVALTMYEDSNAARILLAVYYLCHSWFYFSMLLQVLNGKRKNFRLILLPNFFLSITETIIMLNGFYKDKVMEVTRYVFLGSAWWVAENFEEKSDAVFISFQTFRILNYFSVIALLFIVIILCINSTKFFRVRLYILIGINFFLLFVETMVSFKNIPVWVITLFMNLLCYLGLYFSCFYIDRKLRDWSLVKFANDMSDGFLLYNENNDLIHVNDLIKYSFSQELIQSFKSKDNLDKWISDTIVVDNVEVVKYVYDGKDVYYKIKKSELNDYNLYLGTIYILHNTTESINKIFTMEQANLELEKAAKMKTDFLANMSHEIRTPMNAVIGMTELALRENLSPNVTNYLLQIQNSGRNLLNIINDILDFSKIEAGKMEIIPDTYEILHEIEDIANVLETRIGDKKLELYVPCETSLPRLLEGDVMRIRQILINLANNAIKFTNEGVVLIKISTEKISEEMINLIIHVIDTGQGIKPEDLTRLFESFQQVDTKRNRSVEGTGLGLAISQKLCEAMDGEIGVTSKYGEGSDFYFNIPQKIVDNKSDLVVINSAKKHATLIHDNSKMLDLFILEMDKLGVDGKTIEDIKDFELSGEFDYLFFDEKIYNSKIKSFLDNNPEVNGVIFINFGSSFVPDRTNLRVMRRPLTTLGFVMMLNGKEEKRIDSGSNTTFKIDFVAPDAKILIVDDNIINITIVEGLLKPINAKCYGVTSGKEAVNKVSSEPFDLIFMDHMMPEVDGVETTKIIRELIPEAADTPIIALTANAMEGVKEMFISAGMNDYVAKPIDIRNLVSKIKQWLPEEKIIQSDAIYESYDKNMSEYEGLDYKKALKALGSAELYSTIVREYYRTGDDRYNEIKILFDNEDWYDYTIKVHALKSNSKQIGAYELGELAQKIEKAAQNKDYDTIYENNDKLLNEFRKILDTLSKYFASDKEISENLGEITDDVLDTILEELLIACDKLDMDNMEVCKERLKKYSYEEETKVVIGEIFDAIDNIDIDTCVELIEKIKIINQQ